ncbi:hypothetical protein RFI_19520 [Reticulomyxa filosa]|uniref:Transmembrane protein n=1 Tax=Reticulomyxa filosa TaxID=46433 RepID=X6MUW5_RETFI|nr:hypothetical protein RFI_19520 [Reticulomyxa filosa]|eukprot:ETO17793.1 hypothetical protein RFI_19520 [Reticulomyxa filosa]
MRSSNVVHCSWTVGLCVLDTVPNGVLDESCNCIRTNDSDQWRLWGGVHHQSKNTLLQNQRKIPLVSPLLSQKLFFHSRFRFMSLSNSSCSLLRGLFFFLFILFFFIVVILGCVCVCGDVAYIKGPKKKKKKKKIAFLQFEFDG